MIHTRYVQSFLSSLFLYFNSDFNSISLIVDDDYTNDKKYYISKLNDLNIIVEEENLLNIKPYNSAELIANYSEIYQYAPLIAILLATRLKINIENLDSKLLVNSNEEIKITKNHSKIFNLEVGRGKSKDILFALKMQAIKPDSLLFDLSLDLNGKQVFKVYKFITDFFKNVSQKS